MDYYEILQVHYLAESEVIDAAYRRLCRIYHPDVNHAPGADEKMKNINNAYEILRDPQKRRAYDESRKSCNNERKSSAKSERPPQTDEARQVLESYFQKLMEEDWKSAYGMLTEQDRINISESDFFDWKINVACCYKIGSFALKPFRIYKNCSIGNTSYSEIREFSICVKDMNVRTGKVGEENCIKYAVLDGNKWRVCVGYSDVTPIIRKFKYLKENADLIDPDKIYADAMMRKDLQTGLLSRLGFIESARKEAARFIRYGNIFTIGAFHIIPSAVEKNFSRSEYRQMCLTQAAGLIKKNIRETDICGRVGNMQIGVVFVETNIENARHAANKLLQRIAVNGELEYESTCGLVEFCGSSVEEKLLEAVSAANFRTIMRNGVRTGHIYTNESSY